MIHKEKSFMKCEEYLNSSVSREIIYFKNIFINQWWESSKSFPDLGKKSSFFQKRAKEKLTNTFINVFVKSLKSFPFEVDRRQNWKEEIKLSLDNLTSLEFTNNTFFIMSLILDFYW